MKKRCPRCAEAVRQEALICRYCGHEFPPVLIAVERPNRVGLMVGGALAAILAIGAAAFLVFKDLRTPASSNDELASQRQFQEPEGPTSPDPAMEELAVGSTLEWSAATSADEVLRRVGPYTLRITKKTDDDFVAPIIEVSANGGSVRLEGELTSPTYSHSISAVQNRKGAPPVVMLQSFSGGAHCCNQVQLAGLVKGRMSLVSLGSWDGDSIETPSDISRDGVADYVFSDNSFLYAFAAYAMSYAPPQVYNVVGGKVVDVSSRPAFRNLYVKSMAEAGAVCRSGSDGMTRNGACPAYVASAARLGKLPEAWSQMLSSYDASDDWEFPTGCITERKDECPPNEVVKFKSYPEALLFFLKEQGYVPKSWRPPEMRNTAPTNPTQSLEDLIT